MTRARDLTPGADGPMIPEYQSMPIEFCCAECATAYEVEDNLAGKSIRCRECNGLNRVPSPVKKSDPSLPSKRATLNLPNGGISLPAKQTEPLPAKKPGPEPIPSSPVSVRYRCPFCNSDKTPVWRNYWTPTSTLVFFLVLAPFLLFFFGCGLNAFFSPLLMAAVHAESDRGVFVNTSAFAVLGGLLFCIVLIAFHVLSGSRLVREARQVCPDCKVRIS
jgi:hypothetical protein